MRPVIDKGGPELLLMGPVIDKGGPDAFVMARVIARSSAASQAMRPPTVEARRSFFR